MSSKVVICGIDTSTLPKLSHAQIIEMIDKAHAGDNDARDQLVVGNMRLVLSIVQRFSHKKGSADDIFQVGCVGLIKAIDNFDTSLNLRFSTYAVPMIIGEIRRFLRDNNSIRVSRSMRDTAYKALQAREKLELYASNDVSIDEVATEMGMPIIDVVSALDAIADPLSLFDPIYHTGEDSVALVDQLSDEKTSEANWAEEVCLRESIAELAPREKEILNLRYYQGKTQIEVSDEIGISQAQVSRLEKNAIKAIRKKMT